MIWHYLVRYPYQGVFYDFSSKGVHFQECHAYMNTCKNGVLSKGVHFQERTGPSINPQIHKFFFISF